MIHVMRVGQTQTFTAPSTTGCSKGSLISATSNPSVATIAVANGTATITAVAPGTATLTIQVPGGAMESRQVQVVS